MNISIEEDGEDIFTPFPKYCLVCFNQKQIKYKLKNKNGFLCCINCGGSYGKSYESI